MIVFSKDKLRVTFEAHQRNFSPTFLQRYLTLLLFTLLLSFNAHSQNMLGENSNELIKFCHSVNGINEGYDEALESYKLLIDQVYQKVINGDKDVVFPIEQLNFESHYGDKERKMASLERLYVNQASGVDEQKAIVEKVKVIQREKNKLEMFAKAFSNYVNAKRYVQDIEKTEVQLIHEKINVSIGEIMNKIMDERGLVTETLFEAEMHSIKDHELKSILIPLNEDIKYISDLLLEAERTLDANEAVIKIKAKRKELALSEAKRLKDAEYYLKNTAHFELYKNFYLRYQSILTKSQNVLSDQSLTKEIIHEEWKLNQVSIEQLRNTYQTIKNNSLADN